VWPQPFEEAGFETKEIQANPKEIQGNPSADQANPINSKPDQENQNPDSGGARQLFLAGGVSCEPRQRRRAVVAFSVMNGVSENPAGLRRAQVERDRSAGNGAVSH